MRYRDIVSPHARVVRIVTSLVFALLAGIGANREWNNWDLLRYHVSFGAKDPQYPQGRRLLRLRAAVHPVPPRLAVRGAGRGADRHDRRPLPQRRNPAPGPQRRVTPAVKTHISVLLGALALIKGVEYYFERYGLVLSRSHVVNGATATSVHANKPALTLLIAIAVIAAALFLYNIRQKGWTLPIVAVALWLLVDILVGAAYPALYQALRVNPSELTRETPYIQHNIDATRAAYGLNNVQVEST